ncbi:c-type cytochrome [Microvirga sp. 2TAF3]|uniref:c-type cytochrome n=1 Tax=Microvirga sp. 2TAF3 TaxID=3233014 RepID=UPI003F9E3DC3
MLLSSCEDRAAEQSTSSITPASFGGDLKRAKEITEIGCGSCHTIPGTTGANGLVGPPLDQMGSRVFVAGILRNTLDNMTLWLRNPQAVVPGNVMPNMGLQEQEARDITAYLYPLR